VKQQNILKVYHLANADEIQNGLLWYRNAHDEAKRLARENGLTLRQTAGVIAAVSPGLRWERNVECAERIIKGEPLDGLGIRWYDGVRKAKRILKGHNPDVVLKGNKVRAFFACILDPCNKLSVCVDGHAAAIHAGRRITLDEVPPMNDRLYGRIAGDYMIVAKWLGILPLQIQAICWLTWRRIHNVTKA